MKTSTSAVAIILLAVPAPAASQTLETEQAVLELTGASSLEELSEDAVDLYSSFTSKALNINYASEKRLVSSGLFTRYQAASLKDYIKRNGPVVSVMELALVDGFDERKARALAHFVTFDSGQTAGEASDRMTVETYARASLKRQEGNSFWSGASKLRMEKQNRWSLAFAAKNGYGASPWPPETVSGSLAFYSRDGRLSLYAGDYASRFGQGLVMWSGFTLSGAQSASSFAKHPSGLSSCWTFSPGGFNRGMAADYTLGRIVLSAFWSPRSASGVNMTYLARYGQFGLTCIDKGRFSADWRWSAGRLDHFGELAFDWINSGPACLAGLTYNFDYKVALSVLARYYSTSYDGSTAGAFRSSTHTSDEKGAALAFGCESLSITADAAFHPSKGTSQHKTVLKFSRQFTEVMSGSLRGVLRYRPQDSSAWRKEMRAEAKVQWPSGAVLSGGVELCKCKETSWLAYGETGYSCVGGDNKWHAFLSMVAFKVDNWDDRIYLYDRDIPGAFSVPSYYGRGYYVSCTATYKWRRGKSLNIKASKLEYPGMIERKPGKTELKCLLIWNF